MFGRKKAQLVNQAIVVQREVGHALEDIKAIGPCDTRTAFIAGLGYSTAWSEIRSLRQQCKAFGDLNPKVPLVPIKFNGKALEEPSYLTVVELIEEMERRMYAAYSQNVNINGAENSMAHDKLAGGTVPEI